jgi:formylglycine-generating enzyme required for sulfatase activity
MSGKFALIIGNTEYTDPGLAQLTAPGRDAEDFARVLQDKNICDFDEVRILLNQISSTIIEAIDEFFDQKKPDDLLVLYFSGHGVRDELGSLYLAVKNTIRSRLRSTAVRSDYIREAMDQSRSKRQVLILDCCNSGAFSQGTKAATGVSIGTASAFEVGYGRIILTASDSTQFAWEGDKVIGETDDSLFTHFLVHGLEGEADLDGDGNITVDELYDYAYEQVKLATPKQTPSKFSSKQQGEIVLRQNIQIKDTNLVPLSDDLLTAMNSSFPYIREGAVSQLDLLLKAKNLSMARSARLALERIAAEDDSPRVAQAAAKVLERSLRTQQGSQKAGADPLASSTRTAQLRREKSEQEARFKAEQTKQVQEKSELEKRLREEQSALEKIEAQQEGREVNRLAPSTSSLKLFGIAIAALMVLAIGFAATRFIPSLSESASIETSVITSAPMEGISKSTEIPVAPITSKDSPTPTEEAPTPIPAEATTATANALLTEMTDGKGVEMVLVPAGTFQMGGGDPNAKSDEKPVHPVTLDAYYIDKFEVTNARYKVCVDAGVCVQPKHTYFFFNLPKQIYYGNLQYDHYPVVFVNWNMAKAYCEWRDARLPTEAEWEKAARGNLDTRIYPWEGNDLTCQEANFQQCVDRTSEVGNLPDGRSPFGTYDMAGNVWEWVADWYSANYYQNTADHNPLGPNVGQSRVLRGGSWAKYDVRVSNRARLAPYSTTFDIGFRCAGTLS